MFPNVHELTKAVQENTKLMQQLLVEIQSLNSNTMKLTTELREANRGTPAGMGPR